MNPPANQTKKWSMEGGGKWTTWIYHNSNDFLDILLHEKFVFHLAFELSFYCMNKIFSENLHVSFSQCLFCQLNQAEYQINLCFISFNVFSQKMALNQSNYNIEEDTFSSIHQSSANSSLVSNASEELRSNWEVLNVQFQASLIMDTCSMAITSDNRKQSFLPSIL